MSTMRWSEPSLPEDGGGIGTTPTIKNHSVTYHRGLLYCFGGYDGRRNNQTLLIYSLREGKWIAPTEPSSNGGFGGGRSVGVGAGGSNNAPGRHEMFGAGAPQYNVCPPGRNGHTATLATSRRRGARGRRNHDLNAAEHPVDGEIIGSHADEDSDSLDGGENMQDGDAMPVIPINDEHNAMDTDDDDEEAQIIIIGGWLGSGKTAESTPCELFIFFFTHSLFTLSIIRSTRRIRYMGTRRFRWNRPATLVLTTRAGHTTRSVQYALGRLYCLTRRSVCFQGRQWARIFKRFTCPRCDNVRLEGSCYQRRGTSTTRQSLLGGP